MAGRNGKRMRATFRERPVILITSIGPEEEYRWKDSVTTGPEIQAWMIDGAAQGMLPWFTKFNGVVPDKRWVEPVVESFGLHAELEPVLSRDDAGRRDRHPRSGDDAAPPRRRRRARTAEADDLGFYQALVEAQAAVRDAVRPGDDAGALDRFKVVILANSTCLSDEQCAAARGLCRRAAAASSRRTRPRPATRQQAARRTSALGNLLGVTPDRSRRAGR